MLKSSVLSNLQNSVGHRVYIEENKYGTIRYFGNTDFADGLWCGIELDEETGGNDGMINNSRYFTCRKNYGIFIPASDVNVINDEAVNCSLKMPALLAKNLNLPETCNADLETQNSDLHNNSVSNDSELTLPKPHKNESYTISKRFSEKQLSVINEENLYNIKSSVKCLDSVDSSYLSIEANLGKHENTAFVEQVPIKSSSKQENEILDGAFEEKYDSDESLGILPHLLECWNSCDDLFYADNFHINLNTTVNLSKNVGECQLTDNNADEFVTSPISSVPQIRLSTKSDESPVCINTSTPKFASTPIHETNYSYVIDEIFPAAQNLTFGLHLNEDDIEVNSDFTLPVITNIQTSVADEDTDPEKNIMNVTCNIVKPTNSTHILLNKTFNNLDFSSGEVCVLPVVTSHKESDLMNKSNIQHYSVSGCNEFIQNVIPKKSDVIINDLDSKGQCKEVLSENILNVTCSIFKPPCTGIDVFESSTDKYTNNAKSIPSDILNTTISCSKLTEDKIVDYSLSERLDDKYAKNEKGITGNFVSKDNALSECLDDKYPENTKSIPVNTMLSYSRRDEVKFIENNDEILNITYEKMNISSDLERKHVNNSQTVIKSKNKKIITPTDLHALKDGSKNKFFHCNKKTNTRKSISHVGRTVENVELKEKKPRRNSVTGSINRSLNSNELTINSYKHTSVKYPINENSSKSSLIEHSIKSDSNLNKNVNSFKSLKSEIADIKNKEVKPAFKAKLKGNELLNETVNIASNIPEVGKTVVKKNPRFSSKYSSVEASNTYLFRSERKSTFSLPEKKVSLNISASLENKSSQESNKNSTVSSNKGNLKKFPEFNNVAEESKHKMSRIPEKHVLSQKNTNVNILPQGTNIPVIKSFNQQNVSKISVYRSQSAKCSSTQKATLKNAKVISGQQINSQQTSQTIKSYNQPRVGKVPVFRSQSTSFNPIQKTNLKNLKLISDQQSNCQQTTQNVKSSNDYSSSQNLRKPLNWESDSNKANMNDTILIGSSGEENTQNFRNASKRNSFIPSLSKIPGTQVFSVCQSNKKQVSEVKSRINAPSKIESTSCHRKNQSKYNLR